MSNDVMSGSDVYHDLDRDMASEMPLHLKFARLLGHAEGLIGRAVANGRVDETWLEDALAWQERLVTAERTSRQAWQERLVTAERTSLHRSTSDAP